MDLNGVRIMVEIGAGSSSDLDSESADPVTARCLDRQSPMTVVPSATRADNLRGQTPGSAESEREQAICRVPWRDTEAEEGDSAWIFQGIFPPPTVRLLP